MSAVYPAGAIDVYGETLALTTAVASLGIPLGFQQAIVYAPGSDFRLSINPALIDAVFFDNSASTGSKYKFTGGDGTHLLHDLTNRTKIGAGGTGTLLDSSQADVDFLYLCFSEPIGGLYIDIQSANGTASTTLKGEYRKNDNTWANLSVTDNTASGGVALAQDGTVTWTAVADWVSAQLIGPAGIVSNDVTTEPSSQRGFWIRLSWDEALDSDTEIDEIWALNYGTTRGYFRAGVEYALSLDKRVVGSIEALLASGSDTLQVTWVKV